MKFEKQKLLFSAGPIYGNDAWKLFVDLLHFKSYFHT